MSAAGVDVEGGSAKQLSQDAASALETVKNGRPSERHAAVRRLGELRTPEARAILLEVALERRGDFGLRHWAAHCYVKAIQHPREARALLGAPDPRIATVGLLALRGEAIDRELLDDLKRCLHSANVHVRTCCGQVIETALANQSPEETVRAVLESIRKAQTVDRADEPMSFAHEYFSVRTEAGWVYETLIRALSQSPSIELKTLQDLTPNEAGLQRDCLLVARAQRGDMTQREELRRIIRTSTNSGIRWAGLRAFTSHGTPDDIPFLEQVARTDPLGIDLTEARRQLAPEVLAMNVPDPAADVYYPIRTHAEQLSRQIKSRADRAP